MNFRREIPLSESQQAAKLNIINKINVIGK